MVAVGKNVKIFVESPSGQLVELTGIVSSFSISNDMPAYFYDGEKFLADNGAWSADIEIKCTYFPQFTYVDEFLFSIEQKKWQKEWKCEYCGHVNRIDTRYCSEDGKHVVGCGARRSFVYG
jgi:hypothetical protein